MRYYAFYNNALENYIYITAGPKDMGHVVKAARAALAGKTIDGGKLAGLHVGEQADACREERRENPEHPFEYEMLALGTILLWSIGAVRAVAVALHVVRVAASATGAVCLRG